MDAQDALNNLRNAISLAREAINDARAVVAQLKTQIENNAKADPVLVFDGRLYDVDVSALSSEGAQIREDLLRDAFSVMVELRAQPGAGKPDDEGDGWMLFWNADRGRFEIGSWYVMARSCICPCFPSEEMATDAIDAVGRSRVERALKVLAMLLVEVSQ